MSTTSIGRQAEQTASDYLTKELGLQVISQNWRTRTCEIDIVMKDQETVYFIEVKYRKNNHSGGGLSSITPKKLLQMKLASEQWLEQNEDYHEYQVQISTIELSGKPPIVTNFIQSLEYDS